MERIEHTCHVVNGECLLRKRGSVMLKYVREWIVWLLTPEDSRDGFARAPETGVFPGALKALFWFCMAILVWKGLASL